MLLKMIKAKSRTKQNKKQAYQKKPTDRIMIKMTEWRSEMMIRRDAIKLSERMIQWGDMHENFGKMN
jgi:hypothetical protein